MIDAFGTKTLTNFVLTQNVGGGAELDESGFLFEDGFRLPAQINQRVSKHSHVHLVKARKKSNLESQHDLKKN